MGIRSAARPTTLRDALDKENPTVTSVPEAACFQAFFSHYLATLANTSCRDQKELSPANKPDRSG
jgi:hypothetical protein